MKPPVTTADARDSLRRLATPHAIDFGARLLQRGSGGMISFREFLAVAREYLHERPEQTAVYLAALVALDMSHQDEDTSRPASVCPN
jgi:hypothetical protein